MDDRDLNALIDRDPFSKFSKTDTLLTHGPPYKIIDRTSHGDFPGCEDLCRCLPSLQPRTNVFGHFHQAHGASTHLWKDDTYPEFQDEFIVLPEVSDNQDPNVDRVVFVHPANWPMGKRRAEYATKEFGGDGSRPIK
ncbi:hypothetical protein PM082_009103 [Marasmius tenuissimus]|nr:hypothetical protein PM082_009103 [Marasmius tenuissimus]